MIPLGIAILAIGGIGSLVCWIMVVVKMFQKDKPLIAVLGILCSVWAFIWGWMKSGTFGLKKIMIIWCVCVGLTIVGNVIFGGAMAAKAQNGDFGVSNSTPASDLAPTPEPALEPESVPEPESAPAPER